MTCIVINRLKLGTVNHLSVSRYKSEFTVNFKSHYLFYLLMTIDYSSVNLNNNMIKTMNCEKLTQLTNDGNYHAQQLLATINDIEYRLYIPSTKSLQNIVR